MADRAVSDVVGFVLIFALVTATVGVVYATGFSGLQDTRDAERVNNAERAFDVLATNVDDVTRRGAPGRATELKLADATLRSGEPVVFNLTVDGRSYVAESSPVVYEAGDSRVVYEGGAVLREEPGGSVLVREPPMTFGDRAVVPFVVTRAADSGVGGSTTVLIRVVAATRELGLRRAGGPHAVTLNVTSPRADAWRRYLAAEAGGTCATVGDTVSCEFQARRVAVPVWRLDVAFE